MMHFFFTFALIRFVWPSYEIFFEFIHSISLDSKTPKPVFFCGGWCTGACRCRCNGSSHCMSYTCLRFDRISLVSVRNWDWTPFFNIYILLIIVYNCILKSAAHLQHSYNGVTIWGSELWLNWLWQGDFPTIIKISVSKMDFFLQFSSCQSFIPGVFDVLRYSADASDAIVLPCGGCNSPCRAWQKRRKKFWYVFTRGVCVYVTILVNMDRIFSSYQSYKSKQSSSPFRNLIHLVSMGGWDRVSCRRDDRGVATCSCTICSASCTASFHKWCIVSSQY